MVHMYCSFVGYFCIAFARRRSSFCGAMVPMRHCMVFGVTSRGMWRHREAEHGTSEVRRSLIGCLQEEQGGRAKGQGLL